MKYIKDLIISFPVIPFSFVNTFIFILSGELKLFTQNLYKHEMKRILFLLSNKIKFKILYKGMSKQTNHY